VLATNLPWAQRLGTPDPARHTAATAIDHASTYLADTTDPDTHRKAADLLARRDHLIATYHTLTRDLTTDRDDHTTNRHRDHGLEL
jgi:hypothetical protein